MQGTVLGNVKYIAIVMTVVDPWMPITPNPARLTPGTSLKSSVIIVAVVTLSEEQNYTAHVDRSLKKELILEYQKRTVNMTW